MTITPAVGAAVAAAIKVPRKALMPDSVTAKLAAASGTGSDCNDITPPQGFSCSVQKVRLNGVACHSLARHFQPCSRSSCSCLPPAVPVSSLLT